MEKSHNLNLYPIQRDQPVINFIYMTHMGSINACDIIDTCKMNDPGVIGDTLGELRMLP